MKVVWIKDEVVGMKEYHFLKKEFPYNPISTETYNL